MRQVLLLVVLLLSSTSTAWCQTGDRMTPELLWKLGRFSGADINSTGTHVAYLVRNYELSENSGTSDLHLIDLTTGTDSVVCQKWKAINSVQWAGSEANEKLFVEAQETGEENDSTQVWTLTVDAPILVRMSNIEGGIANLKVASNAKRLAYTADIKMDKTVNDLYADLPKADARIIDHLMYRHWNSWHDFAYSHVLVVDIGDDGALSPAKDIMDGIAADCPVPPFGGNEQFAWAPDASELVYTTKISDDWAQSTDSALYAKKIGSDESAKLLTPDMPGYDNDPNYSPDGKWVLFHSMERPGFEADRNRVMLINRETGAVTEITKGLDQPAHGTQWSPDGKKVYFTSEMKGTQQIYEMTLDTAELRPVSSGRFDWDLIAVFPDGKSALVGRQNMLRPTELFQMSLLDGSVVALSHINDEIYATLELPVIEERMVEASDGKQIHCWVILPPDFDPKSNHKWPLLTYCQGGPQSQIGQWFSFRWNFHLMAANGYVVVAPNRRGLPGFGQEWNDEISKDWGGQAMRDILAATDAMANENYIDRDRMGAVGASFGGYTVYWLMGNHADRFKTMIAHCGVFNLESMYGSTEELFFVKWDLGGPYWEGGDIAKLYDRFSPHRFAKNWDTPLLVIHGEKDFRVPVTQGMEAFTVAQVQDVPSRFLYFPDEGHWVQSPQNGVLWHRVFFDWLDRYLKPNAGE
ncbi:MAG: S9 family peptidase [Pirellulaceae bacterium]